jgi:hypothetical protein
VQALLLTALQVSPLRLHAHRALSPASLLARCVAPLFLHPSSHQ